MTRRPRCRYTGCGLKASKHFAGAEPGAGDAGRLQNFKGTAGSLVLLPDDAKSGTGLGGALLGLGDAPALHGFGAAASGLPEESVWRIMPGDFAAADAALGFLLGAYQFDRLKTQKTKSRAKLAPDQVDAKTRIERPSRVRRARPDQHAGKSSGAGRAGGSRLSGRRAIWCRHHAGKWRFVNKALSNHCSGGRWIRPRAAKWCCWNGKARKPMRIRN